MAAIARRCDQTGQDRTAVIIEALAAGLGVEPDRDRIDALEARVTALESKLIESQSESRNVTRKVSRKESQTEPRESQPASQPKSRDELPERISYTTMGRNSKAVGQNRDEFAAAHGYQKHGKGNRAFWTKIKP